MKRLFMTFVAMLLMSASAFAQSSETPLKGDVNEDGVVDVADITAIIAIIKNNATLQQTYYYVGTTQPTASNISSLSNYSSLSAMNGETISIPNNGTLYLVCPTGELTEENRKNGNIIDSQGYITKFSKTIDTTTISGHSIYNSEFPEGDTITLRF